MLHGSTSKKNKGQARRFHRFPKEQPIPLSYGQERLWVLQQLSPENPQYHFSEIFYLTGPLDIGALQNAFLLLLKRHDILRTTFQLDAEIPRQHIHGYTVLPWTFMDFSWDEGAFDEKMGREFIKKEVRKPFNLEEGPLFRISLLKIKDDLHWLVLTFHHIIVDEQSIRILLHDIKQAYGNPADSPEDQPQKGLQYADFAYWQRKQPSIFLIQKPIGKKNWRVNYPFFPLPFDYSRPSFPKHSGAYAQRMLPLTVKKSVEDLK